MTQRLQRLLDNNRVWAQHEVQRDPAYFSKLLDQQSPEYLWIAARTAAVPGQPDHRYWPRGEVFVQRNVATWSCTRISTAWR